MFSADQIFILADDLTGAADAAAAFARSGAVAEVRFWDESEGQIDAGITAVSTESRELSAAEATERFERVFDLVADGQLFIKVDSLLRGHVRDLVASVVARTNRPVVFAPAHPRQGRQTRGGRQYANGRDEPLVDLRDLVPREVQVIAYGKPDGELAKSLVPGGVLIADAEEPEDLEELVASLRDSAPIWVGSAGLAAALAETLPLSDDADVEDVVVQDRLLFIIGSASQAAREQAEAASAVEGLQRVVLGAPELSGNWAELTNGLRALLAEAPVLVSLEPPSTGHPLEGKYSEALASITSPLVNAHVAAVIVGGFTAAAILRSQGIARLRVHGECSDGVPIMSDPSSGVVVITKAGEFGDLHVLSAIASKHMSLRKKRNLA